MSNAATWNERFTDTREPGHPCEVLTEQRQFLPGGGTALDLACGVAGNGLLLAEAGLAVHLWDFSDRALELQAGWFAERGLPVVTELRDCEALPPTAESFDVITVAHFLHRPICAQLAAALKPGGILYYQTFTVDSVSGPRRPEYRLQRGELPGLFSDLENLHYREQPPGKACFVGRHN